MNNIFKIKILILIMCILFSCKKNYTENKIILEAEKLLNTSPDSSFKLLKGIPQPEELSNADYAAWCLQFTHVRYKMHKITKPDSILNFAIDYYKNTKLLRQCGTAYYLYGCILSLNSENDKAVLALKQAEEILTTTNDIELKGLVTFNIGYVCLYEELYNHSLNYFRKSLNYFRLSKNKKYAAYAYSEISNMYNQLEYPTDSIMNNLNIAIQLSKQSGDSINYLYLLTQKGVLLADSNYVLSKQYIMNGYKHFPQYKYYFASFLAHIYSKLNQQDSAKYYLSIALTDSTNEIYKTKCYNVASQIAINERDYKKAYDFLYRAYVFRDSTYRQNLRGALYKVDKRFDLSQKEKENATLTIANRNKVLWIALLIITVLFVSIILMIFNFRQKKNIAKLEMDSQRLKFEAEANQIKNLQKRDMLLLKLNGKIANTLKFNRLKMAYIQHEKKAEFIEEITKQSILNENEWSYYIEEVNKLFENRIENLKQKNTHLTPADLIVIALLCLKVNISDSCMLLEMTKNTMYMRRKTIKKRLELDIEDDLEKWVRDHITRDNA